MSWLDSIAAPQTYALYLLSGISILLLGGFSLVSLREGERRAAFRAAVIALALGLFFLIAAYLPAGIQFGLLAMFLLLVLTAAALFFLHPHRDSTTHQSPESRYDERDIPFARIRLVPGSPQYRAYYQLHPERQAFDDRLREKPGLLSPNAKLADPLLFAASNASFFLTESLAPAVDGEVSPQRVELPSGEMSAYLKSLARYYGAREVGITRLQPYHVYSHIGRGLGEFGAPLPFEGGWAIAFTVEMDYRMTVSSPQPPVVMESAHQYAEAARTAIHLAAAIRQMGYQARAHIDGNYRVICPLVARDAGLGEIGRIGLLMTPRLGPRVRLGVVTTELELEVDQAVPTPAVIDFCTICQKCADCCPPQALPQGPQESHEGISRWKINADKCYSYWCTIGTDCARCMAVCPYAHPDSFYHNLVRWGIARSWSFRRLALWMDDFFYGEKPASRTPPPWTRHSNLK